MYGLVARLRAEFIGSLTALGLLFSPGAQALLISQIYGGGGNSGATYSNDFIEIFNDSAATVNLSGLSVQYASAAGTAWQKTDLAGLLGPYSYYLIQEAPGSGGGTPLPTPDAVGSINLSATSGKVALASDTAALTPVGCPTVSILDFVGYGAADCFEGAAAVPPLSNTLAALRLLEGLTDTDNNAGDFSVLSPDPRNTASPQNLPAVVIPEPGTAVLTAIAAVMLLRRRPIPRQELNRSLNNSSRHRPGAPPRRPVMRNVQRLSKSVSNAARMLSGTGSRVAM